VLDFVVLVGSIAPVFSLLFRALEFFFYHLLLTAVDRVSRLPRGTMLPEAMRLYRENIALKAQLDALEAHLRRIEAPRRVPLAVRATQVFALFLNRDNEPFLRYFLSAARSTVERWASIFRHHGKRTGGSAGRPPLDEKIVELILTLKRENMAWGQRRIREELRRMGIVVSEPTIQRVLRENGFTPEPGPKLSFERFRSGAKDALWAVDFFAVKTAKGAWMQVLLVIDLYTRELLDLRVHDSWDVDSRWTTIVFHELLQKSGRKPIALVHDRGSHFQGTFQRALGVLDIDEEVTLARRPMLNCYAERAIGSVRRELLRHIRVADAFELQFYLDEYRTFANAERAHQGIDGRTPREVSTEEPEAEVLDLAEARRRKLVRRSYANGLLVGYSLEPSSGEAPSAKRAA
jgi:transposase-like protein